MVTIVMAGFKISEEKSVVYTKHKTVKGFSNAIRRAIEELDVDYVSVRIIKPK